MISICHFQDEIVKLLEAWSQKDVQALLGHCPPKTQEVNIIYK